VSTIQTPLHYKRHLGHGKNRQVTRARQATNPALPKLLSKREIVAITGVTYPTIWAWMRDGKFPRPRVLGGKSCWPSAEIESWIAALPVRRLKGDAESEAVMTVTGKTKPQADPYLKP
jgi:predicted DNA-binding transcriptional regulator AlpA